MYSLDLYIVSFRKTNKQTNTDKAVTPAHFQSLSIEVCVRCSAQRVWMEERTSLLCSLLGHYKLKPSLSPFSMTLLEVR